MITIVMQSLPCACTEPITILIIEAPRGPSLDSPLFAAVSLVPAQRHNNSNNQHSAESPMFLHTVDIINND